MKTSRNRAQENSSPATPIPQPQSPAAAIVAPAPSRQHRPADPNANLDLGLILNGASSWPVSERYYIAGVFARWSRQLRRSARLASQAQATIAQGGAL